MRIADFATLSTDELRQAAQTLRDALAGTGSALAELRSASAEVESFLHSPERFALAAVDGTEVLAWIGWIAAYSHAWKLHPLAVAPPRLGNPATE